VGTTQATVCGEPVANQVSWTSLNNGYQVTQYYHGTVYPDGNTFFGGTQDNGTLRGSFAGGQNWDEILGGDGGYVAVNTTNTNILYAENTGKSLQRSSNGGRASGYHAEPRRTSNGLTIAAITSSSTRSRWTRPTRAGSGTAARRRFAATTRHDLDAREQVLRSRIASGRSRRATPIASTWGAEPRHATSG
jgi:hypothetical protein